MPAMLRVLVIRQNLHGRFRRLIRYLRGHLPGELPYATYRTVLQASSLHIYLTYPFVLSWPMLAADGGNA